MNDDKQQTGDSRVAAFEAMLERGQDSDMLRYTLGNSYWQLGDLDRAQQHLTAAIEHNHDYSAAWKTLGRVLIDAERFDEAVDVLTNGIEIAQKNGDKQSEKEMQVFVKRALKQIDASS